MTNVTLFHDESLKQRFLIRFVCLSGQGHNRIQNELSTALTDNGMSLTQVKGEQWISRTTTQTAQFIELQPVFGKSKQQTRDEQL
jgi:hypothetical protein